MRPDIDASAARGSSRHRLQLTSPKSGRAMLNGKPVVVLGSNDYLGLAGHPKVIESARRAIEAFGAGTAMNPTLCTTPLHESLAERIAAFAKTEAALLFNSCTSANVALLQTLAGQGDVIFSDQLNHASIVDGCRLSRARTVVYPHRDPASLAAALANTQVDGMRIVISDGVFSMEGDTAALPSLLPIAEQHRALVVIDESHAAGVIGPGGRGTAAHHGVEGRIDIQTGTFSKALGGGGGGYVAGSRALIDFLYEHARFFIFTSPMSPLAAATALAALEVLQEETGLIEQLRDNVKRFRDGLSQLGFRLLGGESPITPILVGEVDVANQLSTRLLDEGVYIPAIGHPIVPRGEARLRAQPSAAHSEADIELAVDRIGAVGRQLHLI